jgi:hypothetical protein
MPFVVPTWSITPFMQLAGQWHVSMCQILTGLGAATEHTSTPPPSELSTS